MHVCDTPSLYIICMCTDDHASKQTNEKFVEHFLLSQANGTKQSSAIWIIERKDIMIIHLSILWCQLQNMLWQNDEAVPSFHLIKQWANIQFTVFSYNIGFSHLSIHYVFLSRSLLNFPDIFEYSIEILLKIIINSILK